GELLAMSGNRVGYEGRLGVISEGALADLLVVEGDPEAGLDWLDEPEQSLAMILKGGAVVKDKL
ncbi:MAG: amidohydrolase family protein, partial [Roseovarius sp.]